MRRLQEAKTLLPTSGHRAKVLATQSLAGALAPRALEMGTVALGKEDPGREKKLEGGKRTKSPLQSWVPGGYRNSF